MIFSRPGWLLEAAHVCMPDFTVLVVVGRSTYKEGRVRHTYDYDDAAAVALELLLAMSSGTPSRDDLAPPSFNSPPSCPSAKVSARPRRCVFTVARQGYRTTGKISQRA